LLLEELIQRRPRKAIQALIIALIIPTLTTIMVKALEMEAEALLEVVMDLI